jgi:hypothetical protein
VKELTEEDFGSWIEHPGTQVLRALLRIWKEERVGQWLGGSFLGQNLHEQNMLNARAIGECDVYQAILDLDLEALNEGTKDETDRHRGMEGSSGKRGQSGE